jgi:methionine biosynthesis protein MetW
MSEPLKSATDVTRVDLLLIASMVEPNTRVLDVGSGDGTLLSLLEERKQVDGRGMELRQAGVNRCVAKGLSVIQGDADKDLFDYPDEAFDYAILSQTLQATHQPRVVLEQLLRIGQRAIVSLPNFAHWKFRTQLLLKGRMPVTKNMPYQWYDTPNIHFCTIKDFRALCNDMGVTIETSYSLNSYGYKLPYAVPWFLQNLIGEQAVFLLKR